MFHLHLRPTTYDPAIDPASTGKDKDVESRTSYLLCNDPAAALYILLLIGEGNKKPRFVLCSLGYMSSIWPPLHQLLLKHLPMMLRSSPRAHLRPNHSSKH